MHWSLLLQGVLDPHSRVWMTHFHSVASWPFFSVPRFTETKPKYRKKTEIPKRAIENIGKMLLFSECWGEMDN